MESDILQTFLDQGLLNVGEEVDKFDYLKRAATDLAERLKKDRRSLIAASSVLLGGDLAVSDPIYAQCESAIKLQWPTYRSRFISDVSQLFRAALLQATAHVTAESDVANAAIVSFTANGLLPFLATRREDAIFREFLLSCGSKVEAEAERIWGSRRSVSPSNIESVDLFAIPEIDATALATALKAAGNVAAQSGTNPHAPNGNPAEWMNHFGNTSAQAIAASVAGVLKDLVPKIVGQARDDTNRAIGPIKSAFDAVTSDTLRADVLYWKEALYSPSIQQSYRRLSPDNVVYWAANDLHLRVPPIHPQSVEFFLRETVRAAIGEEMATEKLTLAKFFQAVALHPEGIVCSHEFISDARLTPLGALHAVVARQVGAEGASTQTGIPLSVAIPREDLAVLLFRDFQAQRLAGG